MAEAPLELPSAATVYLGLGSNLGDRTKSLERAIELISRRTKLLRRSPVYETEPVGVPEQGKFLNMAIEIQTHLPPRELLTLLKGVEQMLGRGTAGSDAPRVIDIDILFYADLKMATDVLTIPHPRLSQRAFVLAPLADMAPRLKYPGTRKTVAGMLADLGKVKGVARFTPPPGEKTRESRC
jgi:2-amino-4-hydroxy-6-hydroxymethyldihydropteridine diphosphokinase